MQVAHRSALSPAWQQRLYPSPRRNDGPAGFRIAARFTSNAKRGCLLSPAELWRSGWLSSAPCSRRGTAVKRGVPSEVQAPYQESCPASSYFSAYESDEESPAPYNKSTYEVLRLDQNGKVRQGYARRRDLLREYRLQPRDLRRIDPTVDVNKTPPSITVKENVVLLCMGGVRAIVTADKALLFEPQLDASRKFIEVVLQHMQSRQQPEQPSPPDQALAHASHSDYIRYYQRKSGQAMVPPFELEILECALMVATGRLETALTGVTQRMTALLSLLPRDINPMNLEELRKVKGALVELEQKADTLRKLLEEVMDDEDELRELNLSSRPRRQDRRRQRERERLERELDRARVLKEEIEERLDDDAPEGSTPGSSEGNSRRGLMLTIDAPRPSGTLPGHSPGGWDNRSNSANGYVGTKQGDGLQWHEPAGAPGLGYGVSQNAWAKGAHWMQESSSTAALGLQQSSFPRVTGPSVPDATTLATPLSREQRQNRIQELRAKFDRARLAELRAKLNWTELERDRDDRDRDRDRRRGPADRDDADIEREDWMRRSIEGSDDGIQEAQEALEEMVEQEEEEQEIEEVEDLIEYYLQRAFATQGESERLLAEARDMEESIGISLSARRYEVNRLELTLSIGSFSAAIGAVVAGIFGMNMRSMLEHSVFGFWGATALIVLGCCSIFVAIMAYTRNKRIL